MINQLLDKDPKRRPTAEDVLKHPWMQKTANLSRRPMVHAAENLRGFHRGRMRLKACLLAVMSGLAGPDTYASDPKSTVGSRTGALKWMDAGGKVGAATAWYLPDVCLLQPSLCCSCGCALCLCPVCEWCVIGGWCGGRGRVYCGWCGLRCGAGERGGGYGGRTQQTSRLANPASTLLFWLRLKVARFLLSGVALVFR